MTTDTSCNPLTVFYDGGCPICAREVGFYRRIGDGARLEWTDITTNGDALAEAGITPDDALARLHARLPAGRLAVGVDAFIEIWQRLPWFRHLAPIARLQPVKALLGRGYAWWADRRPRSRATLSPCDGVDRCSTSSR